MNRLDRYLFRQSAVPFASILACTTAVIWLTQVLQRAEFMVEDGGSFSAFLKITLLLVPSLIGVIAPFAMLAATLYALNVLATDNELSVMSAAGASRMRLARPLILLGALGGALVLVINVDLQPRSYRLLKETVEQVRSDVAKAFIRSGVFATVTKGVTVYAEEVLPGDQYVALFIHDARDPTNVKTYTAERGMFRVTAQGPRLMLAGATLQRVDPKTGKANIVRSDNTSVDITTLDNGSPTGRNREATERYVSELLAPDLSSEYDRERAGQFIAEGHARLATPLYPVAFALIALALMLSAPVARKGYGRRVFMVIALAILLRTGGYVVQSASASVPQLNIVQYVMPLAAVLVCASALSGKFWRVRRRPPPDLSIVLDNPSKATALPQGA